MASVTFSIDEKFRRELEKFPWINWSEITRKIFREKVERQGMIERMDHMLEKSELTDDDISAMSKRARRGRFAILKSKGLV